MSNDTYRTSTEGRLAAIEARIEARIGVLEAAIGVLEASQNPGFVERWRERGRAFIAPAAGAFGAALLVWGVAAILALGRGCTEAGRARLHEAGERCAAVCLAIGMDGSSLADGTGGVDTPESNCYCGTGSRLVVIYADGTIAGFDTTTGAVIGDEP